MRPQYCSLCLSLLIIQHLLLAPALPASAQAESLLAKGRQLAVSGRLDEALELFSQFRRRHPGDPRSYLYSGIALVDAGRIHDAELELNQALQLKPLVQHATLELAQVLERLGRPLLAIQVLEDFRTESTLGSRGLWLLSELYLDQKKAAEALTLLELYQKQSPRDPRAALRRGEALLMEGQLEPALEAFETAAGLDPDDEQIFFGLGQTLFRGNNFQAAKKMLLRAVAMRPADPDYLHLLGVVLARTGQEREAIELLQKAVEMANASPQIYFDLGTLYRQAGQNLKAREALKKYQQLYQETESKSDADQKRLQLINQGQRSLESGQLQLAERDFLRVLNAHPDDWTSHISLAKIYLSTGMSLKARSHLEKLETLDSASSEVQYLAGLFWQSQSELRKALTYAQRGVQLRPGDAQLRNLLGNLHFALKQYEKALSEYEAAAELAPDQVSYRLNVKSAKRMLDLAG